MARRRSTQRHRAPRRLSPPAPACPWPQLQELIASGGTISIGAIHPIPCAAIANDEHNMLAALVRRDKESLVDMLKRLDGAVGKALEHDEFTDEINPPPSSTWP